MHIQSWQLQLALPISLSRYHFGRTFCQSKLSSVGLMPEGPGYKARLMLANNYVQAIF